MTVVYTIAGFLVVWIVLEALAAGPCDQEDEGDLEG